MPLLRPAFRSVERIEIAENGAGGKCARFEMVMPRAGCRIEHGAASHRAGREAESAAH